MVRILYYSTSSQCMSEPIELMWHHLLLYASCAHLFNVNIVAQMCQNYGKQCFTHSDCCGGCCTNGFCVDTTNHCSTSTDCLEFYCPAGMSCALHQTPDCPGCSIVPYCRHDQLK